jgi:hypothetical protein
MERWGSNFLLISFLLASACKYSSQELKEQFVGLKGDIFLAISADSFQEEGYSFL